MPRADTGSAFLNWVGDTLTFFLHLERRFDHWLRPPFDATLRDPIACLVTALINLQRKNEGLKIAEEKPLPNEEEYLNSIISSFTTQMRGLWKPGGFERGGNTKTHGIVRGEEGHLCKAADLPVLGAFFRPRSLHHSGHR